MRFFYLLPAHNEEGQLVQACERLKPVLNRFSGSRICLLDNGSQDGTWTECLKLQSQDSGLISAFHEDRAGLGLAFRMGLNALPQNLGREDWVVLTAADLPFGFSDLESVLARLEEGSNAAVFIGSKSHPRSVVRRTWVRRLGTLLFFSMRKLIIGLAIRDTQGTIFIRGDFLKSANSFSSDDYFFAVELLDHMQRSVSIEEVAVVLEEEIRPSRVRFFRDGWRLLRQLMAYRRRRYAAARRRL